MLHGKTIVLGITGGIAAYKAAALCSKLTQAGAAVHVIMTKSATQFISELTLQTLSRQPVYTDTFDERDPSVVSHINLADSADLFLIAPATANIIAKMTYGLADDMLSTSLLATTAPIMVAPAMNVHMYAHPAVQQNLNTLRERGVFMVEPGEGLLACGYVGKGRLAEPEYIVEQVEHFFSSSEKHINVDSTQQEQQKSLTGRSVIVTAGGTIERIDPVRYITNDSSGKMGFAVAAAARDMGAEVTLIAGQTQVTPPEGVHLVRVESTQDMYDAVLDLFPTADVVVKAAAVADYKPVVRADRKMKKTADKLMLELERNPDILATLGEQKQQQVLIGFAAETNDVQRYAMDKLHRKNCDLIVANDVSRDDAGFGTDNNEVQIYDRNGLVESIALTSKSAIAHRIMELAVERIVQEVHAIE
ncbi:bifunctional phosphopantothenoylcysteine decarboxylase/phosphopantothenate--cysteine ligase CoaBC [Paenibacillus sp. UMB4589-SE434]|uniref:bifunctional phosphopantothenoylcysteine decarboxylase/phosphopantothenate--cysteine ligase CoaBC n=1 Tax=Paenibacillus sp. UMB4589-SE434 TaxID=3046314 RepID=UPI00254B17CD|nr:bifunctional phosphopantothenoylcysteine decarboxylase/phosphopantothenate--cysteine ligase CoaBC [Paenibacillus sp. UMB4589-SE434]MDK8180840.1 bifunctional phosphopantothenoylcysteine decarboxylase/phosphopantothenate--cysteine ligase CoaBC [Paenibacillus sp. UMB4589-SE434]